MEIIEKGSLPSEKIYTCACTKCATRFKFKRGEAKYNSDQRDGDYLSIVCPLEGCGNTCYVNVR